MIVQAYCRLLRLAFLATTVTPLLYLTASRHLQYLRGQGPLLAPAFLLTMGTGVLAVAVLNGLLGRLLRRLSDDIDDASAAQAHFADTLSERFVAPAIVASAGLSLFLELAVIRWQVSIFPILAFYKNFGLLAAFGGLGLGYALAGRSRIPLVLVGPVLGLQIVSQMALKHGFGAAQIADVVANPFVEELNYSVANVKTNVQLAAVYITLTYVFLLTALAFIPVGQLAGRLMQRTANLRAYGLNLLGSLLGVVLMHVVSMFCAPPAIWFALSFLVLISFMVANRAALLTTACASLLTLVALAWPATLEIQAVYSPYQLIEVMHSPSGYMHLHAAGAYYQRIENLDELAERGRKGDEHAEMLLGRYSIPFWANPDASKVAVVGAGTGNDVSAGLINGAESVTAVDIDPVIVRLGRIGNPHRPYDSPNVKVVVDDARSFFRTTDEQFDLIVYGLLDSHAVLSHASNVRMDSFVYTVEGLREARSCLKDGGVMSLSFYVMTPELAQKLYLMMKEAFDGRPPVAIRSTGLPDYVFMQAQGRDLTVDDDVLRRAHCKDVGKEMAQQPVVADVSTDDWPFFYMPRRVYPYSYLGMVAMVLVLTSVLLGAFMAQKPEFSHAVFFFLGAGFMLIETRGITELGLTFGNTWHVIGVVISGILFMAFLANLVVARWHIRNALVPFAVLFAALALGYVLALSGGLPSTSLGRIGAVVVLTCPIFFSGIVFSTALSSGKNVAAIMAANLMGAMCGGLLEYNSMKFGFQSLYLFGFVLYALAALSYLTARPSGLWRRHA